LASRPETRWEGQPPRDLFHGLDQAAVFAPITKWQGTVRRPEEIAPVLEQAFAELRRGRPGPVMIDVPADLLAGPAPGDPPPLVPPERAAADPGAVEQAVTL